MPTEGFPTQPMVISMAPNNYAGPPRPACQGRSSVAQRLPEYKPNLESVTEMSAHRRGSRQCGERRVRHLLRFSAMSTVSTRGSIPVKMPGIEPLGFKLLLFHAPTPNSCSFYMNDCLVCRDPSTGRLFEPSTRHMHMFYTKDHDQHPVSLAKFR